MKIDVKDNAIIIDGVYTVLRFTQPTEEELKHCYGIDLDAEQFAYIVGELRKRYPSWTDPDDYMTLIRMSILDGNEQQYRMINV